MRQPQRLLLADGSMIPPPPRFPRDSPCDSPQISPCIDGDICIFLAEQCYVDSLVPDLLPVELRDGVSATVDGWQLYVADVGVVCLRLNVDS